MTTYSETFVFRPLLILWHWLQGDDVSRIIGVWKRERYYRRKKR